VSLPDVILEPVRAAGEEVLGSLLTAGTRAWLEPDGSETAAPLWVVATDRRLWLLAAANGRTWAAAEGDVRAVHVDRGWTWDALVAGEWRAPLRRGTRAAAEALVKRLASAPGGGERLPPPPEPVPPQRAAAARGSSDVPEWLAQSVPAEPGERWLHALETSSTQPFNLPDGTVGHAPVFVAHTDARVVLAARVDGRPTWFRALSEPLVRQSRPGRDRLLADERVLWGPMLSDRPAEVATALSAAPSPRARWAVAARSALEDGRARDAVRLLAEGHDLGHDPGYDLLGRLLLAIDLAPLAVAAVARELELEPNLDVDSALGRWNASTSKALVRDKVDAGFVRGLLRDVVGALEIPDAPAGLPWPPRTPPGVWAAALAVAGRHDEALALWARRTTSPRQRQAIAALREASGAPDAAGSWDEAAAALRVAGDADAIDALDRALRLDPNPARLWRRAAWAFADGDLPVARDRWSAAIALDPTAEHGVRLPAEAERLVAEVAEADDEPAAAAAAWRRVLAEEPGDAEALRALATDLQAAGEVEGARATIADAVATDFLHPKTYEQAIALGGDRTDWWRHLHALLVGGEGAPGAPPVEALAAERLDALHPGGVGMLERLKQRLGGAEPPDRRTLVRGLARLEADHPQVAAEVERLCGALDLAPPEVYLFRGEGAWGASAWGTTPPVLLVGADHLREGPRALDLAGLAFLVAVELVHLKCDHPVLSFDADLVGTSRSMYATFGKYAGTAENVVDVVTLIPGVDQLAKLQTIISLSRRVFATRSAIDKVGGITSPVLSWLGVTGDGEPGSVGRQGLEGAALTFRIQADRAALLLTGDLRAAVRAILLASSTALDAADRVASEGLAAVLANPSPPAESLRIAALVEFAAGLDTMATATPLEE
jgi:tetratricopeptide (TPR) repeat protein